ncbi:MAG: hypothetical protein K2H20_04155, partial [Bacilli bacterium]|nr:hypothetical protein [Bacilli bacterium]
YALTRHSVHFPYVARQGLNPLQLIISRKDEAQLNKSERIPLGFLQAAQSLSISENLEKNEFFGTTESSNKLIEDRKRFIITYRIITPEEKKEQEKQTIKDEERILGYKSNDKKGALAKRLSNKLKDLFRR